MRRALPFALAALVVAGCGSHGSVRAAASYAPADAEAFVSFRTDANWRPFARLVLGRVPHVPDGAREAAFALVDGRLIAVSRTGSPPAHALAAEAAYSAALHAMPHGVDGVGYVRGDVVSKRLHATPGMIVTVGANTTRRFRSRTHRFDLSTAVLQFRWGAAWLTKDGIGARVHTGGLPVAETQRVRSVEQLPPPYAPTLLDEIPADARFVLDLPLAPGAFELVPQLPAQVTALFARAQIGVAAELDALLQGETALYTRPGGEVTLVTQPADTEAARRAVAELRASATPALRARPLHLATLGGQLVVSTSKAGIAAFRSGRAKLSTRVHLPPRVVGVVYSADGATAWGGTVDGDPTLTVRFEAGSR